MARIRTVKPELFRHEELFEAELETGFPLRLAFIGLFTVADREGIFRWQPRQLKLDVMPYDSHDFSRVLDALVSRGFVVKYASQGDTYGLIPSFTRHQVINNRERASGHPSIEDADEVFPSESGDLNESNQRVDDASVTRHGNIKEEGKGREGKGTGREQEGKGNGKARVNESVRAMIDLLPGLSEESANEYLSFRKAKKAPLTPGAWKKIASEIKKSGLSPDDALNTAMARGWQGFESAWLSQGGSSVGGFKPFNKQAATEENNARVVREIMEREAARMAGGEPDKTLDLGEPITLEGEFVHAFG